MPSDPLNHRPVQGVGGCEDSVYTDSDREPITTSGKHVSDLPAIPLIIAHRGGKFWEGSNFSYISQAVWEGADIVELDIRVQDHGYVVQHAPWEAVQGSLHEAIQRLETAGVYLDIKDSNINVNQLIRYVRSQCLNHIIVGSFRPAVLRSITDESVTKNYHCIWPYTSIDKAREAGANWINPICYVSTSALARKIIAAGFAFVPSGNLVLKKNEILRNQVRYASYGAYAICTHHVKEMKTLLLEAA